MQIAYRKVDFDSPGDFILMAEWVNDVLIKHGAK